MLKNQTLKDVINGNYCVGCGACAFKTSNKMKLNQYGEYIPEFKNNEDSINDDYPHTCPSLKPELNEDILAAEHFIQHAKHDKYIGYHINIYGGYANEEGIRANATSGGMGTWIGIELLRLGLIDGVIHAKKKPDRQAQQPFFTYQISRTEDAIFSGAKTRYHVLEMSEVLNEVKSKEGKYLFVGVPCFCKAVRRLQKTDTTLAERIPFVASLVCGHYKSLNWTLSLGWGTGIHPESLKHFQYRTKAPDIPARSYVFRAFSENGEYRQEDSAKVTGGKFNAGAMMLNACDYCDDVVGETADITIGDAWLPRFDINNGGTNLIITRNPEIDAVISNAHKEGRLQLESVTAQEAFESQAGGFRQRREGLSFRLEKAQKQNVWAPIKRVSPGGIKISSLRKKIYTERSRVAKKSRQVFVDALIKDSYQHYEKGMSTDFKKLRQLELSSSLGTVSKNKLKRLIEKVKRTR